MPPMARRSRIRRIFKWIWGVLCLAIVSAPRYSPGHCQSCDYNLTGNVSGICPECGTPIPDQAPKTL
jgi:hypothetical protein